MKIKKNDTVKIIKGKDNGKQGKVIRVLSERNRVVVEGLNLAIKNARPKKAGDKGQRVQFPASMDVCKVMLVCPHCNRAVRVGYTVFKNADTGKIQKARMCKKCNEVIA